MDSIYSFFDTYRIAELFKRTKATIAIGYALLPLDLILGKDIGIYVSTYDQYTAPGDGFSVPEDKSTTWAAIRLESGKPGYAV